MILLLSRDIFFASKVTGTAQQLALDAMIVTSLDTLQQYLAVGDVTAVILDLGCEITPAEVKAAVQIVPRPKLIAFGPHVDATALQSAQEAGFNEVMPRSKFSATLPQLLQSL